MCRGHNYITGKSSISSFLTNLLSAHEVYSDQLILTGRRMLVREDDVLDRVSVVFLYEEDIVETPPGLDDDGRKVRVAKYSPHMNAHTPHSKKMAGPISGHQRHRGAT